jgi:enoyl-CoA hydratase/carnithine racemase
MEPNITCDIDDGVAVVTINRPDKLNAFLPTMYDELIGIIDRTDHDDAVRAVVLTGAGRAFCAGADLSRGGDTFDKRASAGPAEYRDPAGRAALRLYNSLKPVIAAVNGAAVGFGASLVLPADIRMCADTARFGYVFAARGIVSDGAASWFLPRVVGINRAIEWCLSGRLIAADEARTAGLVSRIETPERLLSAAVETAGQIAAQAAPVSAVLTRRAFWEALSGGPFEAHLRESRALLFTGGSADAREGVRAYLDKRPAQWSMRPSRDLPDWLDVIVKPAPDERGT